MPASDGRYARMRVPAPSAGTGAGFWTQPLPITKTSVPAASEQAKEAKEATEYNEEVERHNLMDAENFAIMGMMAKVFVSQAVGFFLMAVAVFSLLAFLTTDDPNHKVSCALSVVINLVAAMHYYAIVQFRRLELDPFARWTSVAIEFAVDACRHSDWLVTLCFLVRKIYFLINHQPFGAGRDLLLSADAAVSLAALMILLGALSRLGTDEMWDWRDGSRQITACVLSGVLPYIGSLVCFVVLMIDFVLAAEGMENAMVFRSFFLVWIGYPLVSIVSIGVRNYSARAVDGYPGYVSPLLSMFKDLAYGLLDCWSKGAFGLYTAHAVFGLSFFGAPAAAPYGWASPSPPAP